MIIIDVRTKSEFDQEHVVGAVWMDVSDIATGAVPDVSKSEEIVLYCRSGTRSNMAVNLLKAKGYKNVSSGGGLSHMAAAGYAVVS